MSSTDNTTAAINPKACNYGCNTRIYWNNEENEYFEAFTKKKHICPNRSKSVTQSSNNKPNYYNVRKSSNYAPKPKVSNSFEFSTGPIETVQKNYEVLSNIVTEYNGKVHGSQKDRDLKTGLLDLLVYYELSVVNRQEIKRKYQNTSSMLVKSV